MDNHLRDEFGLPTQHEVQTLRSAKEPIAQLTDSTVGVQRMTGRGEDGLPEYEKICPIASIKMLDQDGTELVIPVQNHRVRTRASYEKYGEPLLLGHVKLGWIPKHYCPLSRAFERQIGGPMAAPAKGLPTEECKIPQGTGTDPDWHGCVHYQAIRDMRRERTQTGAKSRKASLNAPSKQQLALLEAVKEQSKALGLHALRQGMADGTRDEADVKGESEQPTAPRRRK